jgi:hypothetical protein
MYPPVENSHPTEPRPFTGWEDIDGCLMSFD